MAKNNFAMKHVIGLTDVKDVEPKERRVKLYDLGASHEQREPQNQNLCQKKKKIVNSIQIVKGKLVKG